MPPPAKERKKTVTSFALTLSCDCKEKLVTILNGNSNINGFVVAKEEYHRCPDLVAQCTSQSSTAEENGGLGNGNEGDANTNAILPSQDHSTREFHVHAYVRFREECGLLYEQFKAWILDNLEMGDISCNVQGCKNERQWIRYITKEDEKPIWRGVDFGLLNLRAKVCYLARRGIEPNSSEPLVTEHFNARNQIFDLWKEMYQKYNPKKIETAIPTGISLKEDVRWLRQFRDGVDNYIHTDWYFKKKQFYLHGAPNVGKTTAVREYCRRNELRMFEPCNSACFPFDGFTSANDYDVIIWDDYRWQDVQERFILTLLQGDHCQIDRKHKQPLALQWRKPIILTSNIPPTVTQLVVRVNEIFCDENVIVHNIVY